MAVILTMTEQTTDFELIIRPKYGLLDINWKELKEVMDLLKDPIIIIYFTLIKFSKPLIIRSMSMSESHIILKVDHDRWQQAQESELKNESIQEHVSKHPEECGVVCSSQVLEHASNPSEFIEAKFKALKKKFKALKKNGLLIVAVPSEDSFLKYVVIHWWCL